MGRQHDGDPRLSRLPREPIDRVTGPLARFLRVETAGGAVLLVCTATALALSNSSWAPGFFAFWEMPVGFRLGPFALLHSARDWINDGLMTLFFFLVALELKRELVLGELKNPRVAALSIAAAVGGMVIPATLYLVLQLGRPGEHGWGTVMATDTAFVIGCLALLGRRAPQGLRVFLLSLAVVDDIGAILVVAFGYSGEVSWTALAVGGVGLAAVRGMALLGVRSVPLYVLAGGLIWLTIEASGIHPTVTGVALGLLTPTRGWVNDRRLRAVLGRVLAYPPGDHWSGDTEERRALHSAVKAARETLSPVERLETTLHPWVAFGVMPLFALANAGVPFSIEGFADPVALAVVAGFVLGKPLGIAGFAWLAVRSGLAVRSAELGWGALAGGGMLAGIGFTMALLIAGLAFEGTLLQAAKLGILAASVISAAGGLTLLALLGGDGGHRPNKGGSRIGKSRMYGSVREALSNGRPAIDFRRFGKVADLLGLDPANVQQIYCNRLHLCIFYIANNIVIVGLAIVVCKEAAIKSIRVILAFAQTLGRKWRRWNYFAERAFASPTRAPLSYWLTK